VNASNARTIVLDTGVDIRRPIEDVFDYCVDLGHEPEWNPEVRRIEGLTPGRPRLGSAYVAEFADGQRILISFRGLERPSCWTTEEVSDQLEAISHGELTSDGETTHLELHLEIRPRGALRLLGPLSRLVLAHGERRHLDAIKARLEAELEQLPVDA
jgi:hypothetical protein